MTVLAENAVESFVVLPLGSRRIAFHARSVIELVAPSKLYNFPHRTLWISGVLVRRNRIVPVCDAAQLLGENAGPSSRFYLIAEWADGDVHDWCAIPVSGECELASASMESSLADSSVRPKFVAGLITVEGREVEVIDLAALIHLNEAVSAKPETERSL